LLRASPLPHPATHVSILMGGRVGERAGSAISIKREIP
jgi:hypothetical protein